MKVGIIGYARSGKDTLAEIWKKQFGMTYESSSLFCAKKFIYPTLKSWYQYSNLDECYEDRLRPEMRKVWYDLITKYNKDDPSKLTREILEEFDCYVGCRNYKEVETAIKEGLYDVVVWVDAEERVGKESGDSCTVTEEQADVIITNNGSKDEFFFAALELGFQIFGKKEKKKRIDHLGNLIRRLRRLGIELEIGGNLPWLYMDKINGKPVTEKFNANHGFTVAFYPMKDTDDIKISDISETFKLIRKYI